MNIETTSIRFLEVRKQMMYKETVALAKIIRNAPLTKETRKALVKSITTEMLAINQFFHQDVFRQLAIPTVKPDEE